MKLRGLKKKVKIVPIIVAYNPDIEKLNNTVSLINDISHEIVVVNNSSYKIEVNNCTVFNLMENKGIAEAQNIGMKYAFENSADFIIQLDQDTLIDSDIIESLLKGHNELKSNGYNVGLIGITPVCGDQNYSARFFKGKMCIDNKYTCVTETLSSGSLISKNIYTKIGDNDPGLFIDLVDFDYCWRLKKEGYQVFRSNYSKVIHSFGEGYINLLFFKIRISTPIRNYYQFRNYLILSRRKYVPVHWKMANGIKIILKLITFWIVFKENRSIRYKYIIHGIIDGFKNRTGSYDNRSTSISK